MGSRSRGSRDHLRPLSVRWPVDVARLCERTRAAMRPLLFPDRRPRGRSGVIRPVPFRTRPHRGAWKLEGLQPAHQDAPRHAIGSLQKHPLPRLKLAAARQSMGAVEAHRCASLRSDAAPVSSPASGVGAGCAHREPSRCHNRSVLDALLCRASRYHSHAVGSGSGHLL